MYVRMPARTMYVMKGRVMAIPRIAIDREENSEEDPFLPQLSLP